MKMMAMLQLFTPIRLERSRTTTLSMIVVGCAVVLALSTVQKDNKKTPSSTGGLRNLQTTGPGSGQVLGTSAILAAAGGTGTASTMEDATDDSLSSAFGNGLVTGQGGSSGFVETAAGTVAGNSVAGAAGTTAGTLQAKGYVSSANFVGAAESTGNSAFLGDLSPSLAGPTGGSGSGGGNLGITASTSGKGLTDGTYYGESTATIKGTATNSGSGQVVATSPLGTTGASGAGAGTGEANSAGNTFGDYTGSLFSSTGTSSGNFGATGKAAFEGGSGSVSGTSNGAGAATGIGSAAVQDYYSSEATDSSSSGVFSNTAGSAGAINFIFGATDGTSAAGAAGSTIGSAEAEIYNSKADFSGAVDSIGSGAFVGVVSPNLSSPTGGAGSGSGTLNVAGVTSGVAKSDPSYYGQSKATTTGSATNFGGGEATATNAFGTAGGVGSGNGSGVASSSGSGGGGAGDAGSIFSGTGDATSNFDNAGDGFFGGLSSSVAFP